LGLLKEFGEHSAGPYARDLLSGFDSRQIHQNSDEPKLSALGEDQEGI
jgi:hypothetical protein